MNQPYAHRKNFGLDDDAMNSRDNLTQVR